ncbi:MAG: hypothetical protein U1F43_25660 [Myxococcota bacterium]
MEASPFTLTEEAKKQIEDTAFAYGLSRFAMRVRMVGKDLGKGFDLAVEEYPLPDDMTFVEQGLRFHIARDLVGHVRGLVIDYKHAGRLSGFVFRPATPEP